MISFLGLVNLLEQLTEFRKTFHLLENWFIMIRYNSGTARWQRCTGQGVGQGSDHPSLSGGATLPASPHVHQSRSSVDAILWSS